MSYFGDGSVREEILETAQHQQRQCQLTNIEMVRILLDVAQYFLGDTE
jgi:hypothetical protein